MKKEKTEYIFFWKHHPSRDGKIAESCLSQWWASDFVVDGTSYWCMEQFLMAEKARLFGDELILKKILKCRIQKDIKALGRQVKYFDEKVWQQNREDIVFRGNRQKFRQNEKLKEYLLSTGEKVLAEASPYDCIWGIGLSANDKGVEDTSNWKGDNLLGVILMEVRRNLAV